MDKKQSYHRPMLRKVRLEAKTSVLGVCHTSTLLTSQDTPIPGAGCVANNCYTTTP